MTHIIIAIDLETFIHRNSSKSPDEIRREVELGVFDSPVPLTHPEAVQLRNFVLITERESPPMLSKRQLEVMELLSYGASEAEIGKALFLSHSGVRHRIDQLKEKFGVYTREELIAVYCRLYRH